MYMSYKMPKKCILQDCVLKMTRLIEKTSFREITKNLCHVITITVTKNNDQ